MSSCCFIFLRMMGLCLSLIPKRDIFVEPLHISLLTILEPSILVGLNKGPSPTENAESVWPAMMKFNH